MAVYAIRGTVPVGSKRAEIDLSEYGMFPSSKAAFEIVRIKTWIQGGGAGGYSFQPAVFSSDVADAVFMADGHLTGEPTLEYGKNAMSAVLNNLVYLEYVEDTFLSSDSTGKIWFFPAKADAGADQIEYEIIIKT